MPGLEELVPGNEGFSYAVYLSGGLVDEFPTPKKARAEARNQARTSPGESAVVMKYRMIYKVKEPKF